MYYNSNRNSNDYYNAYKRELAELEAYKKEENIQKVMKLVLSLLAIGLIIAVSYYLYKYFNPTLNENSSVITSKQLNSADEPLPKIVIREDELPQSIQLRESMLQVNNNIHLNATDTESKNLEQAKTQKLVSSMNEKDIALIVQIILSQINTKTEQPLEKQLDAISKKEFKTKSLEKTNHYNKIVLAQNSVTDYKNNSLVKLSDGLNNIIQEPIDTSSNYTESIQKEIVYRKNEMRFIIVQKGDTLSRIAKRAYDDYDAYPKIFTANPEIIKNPDQIFVGQRLRIPG